MVSLGKIKARILSDSEGGRRRGARGQGSSCCLLPPNDPGLHAKLRRLLTFDSSGRQMDVGSDFRIDPDWILEL